jgi:hypothetical protein
MAQQKPDLESLVPPAEPKPQYRALVNWRHGTLYLMDQYHTLEGVPQEEIDKAIAAGYLEKV